MRKIFLTLFLSLLCSAPYFAQTVSTAWTWPDFDNIVGYDGTKPSTEICHNFIDLCNGFTPNIPNVSVNGTTVTVNQNQVNLALNHISQNYTPNTLQVLYFPPGTYLISNSISLDVNHRNIILRGRGSANTTLRFTGSGSNFITVTGSFAGNSTSCWGSSSGTALYLNATNQGFGNPGNVPEYARIWRSLVPNADCRSTAGDQYNGQIVKITGTNSQKDRLYIQNRLRQSYYNVSAQVREINPAYNNGIECLKIDGSQAGGSIGQNAHITFERAVNCWVKGVESYKPLAQHVKIFNSSNVEVSGCYFHEAQDYGSGGHGYGVNLSNATGECLIVNNIFRKLRHAMMVQLGANGNGIAYNYSREKRDFRTDWLFHGRWPHRNLMEGNVVEKIAFDTYHGRSGDYNFIFRNRTYKKRIKIYGGTQYGESCSAVTNKVAIVGNDVDNNISVSNTTSGHTIYDNLKNGSSHGNGYGLNSNNASIGNSYLYNSRPSWFPSFQGSWPAIGPGSGGNNMIPALYRWNNTQYNLTVGGDCSGCIPPAPFTLNYSVYPCSQDNWGNTSPGTITLFRSGGSTPYQNTVWSTLGGPPLGFTSNTSATFYGPGAYQAQVTDAAGTVKTVTIYVGSCNSGGGIFKQGVEPEAKPFSAEVFPNPSRERASLKFYLPEATSLDISLFNLNGELIQLVKNQGEYTAGEHQLDLQVDQLSQGIYFCRIVYQDEVKVIKLIKQ